MRTLLTGELRPNAGDLVLASVDTIGKHQRLELPNGRRARLCPGDEVIVTYGNRYAPDQYEALISEDLGGCDLVASGGIASRETCRHDRMTEPTRIIPRGLVGRADGSRINLSDYAITAPGSYRDIPVVLVAGTAMNSGKTLTAASLIRWLASRGLKVAGIKVTGTGSGGDLWTMKDMGAQLALDFTDAGFASTYKTCAVALENGAIKLIDHASEMKCDIAVVEIADGLEQEETAALLCSRRLTDKCLGIVFAAYDALGSKAGVEKLRDLGLPILAISGQVARSPLAIREARKATNLPVYTPLELETGALYSALHKTLASGSIAAQPRPKSDKIAMPHLPELRI